MNNNIKMYGDGWCDVLIIVHTSIPSGIVTHKNNWKEIIMQKGRMELCTPS